MTKKVIIERAAKAINRLPEDKTEEIADFADFLSKRYEENQLTKGIQALTANSIAFDFLNEEEELYSVVNLSV